MECPFCQNQTSPHSKNCDCCGEAIPPAQHLLEESGVIEPSPPPAPVASPRRPVRTPLRNTSQYRFARLGDRFIAFVLDTAILFGVFTVVDAWVFMRWGVVEGTELQLTTASLLIATILNAAILFLYGWLLEAGCGATLGKAMLGIRVVGTTQRGPLSACAVRNALRIVDGIGFYFIGTVVAACSGSRQRFGDMYARTAVIEDSFGIGIRVAAIVLWIATLVGAGWAVPRICSFNHAVPTPYLSQVVVRVGKAGNAVYFTAPRFTMNVQLAPTPR
jgi:uncharacterized RDD family membrane protein YckC